MGNGPISSDDDEVTQPTIRMPELLPPLRPPLSGRPPPLPLGRTQIPTPPRPLPPPRAMLQSPPNLPGPLHVPPPLPPLPPRAPVATAPRALPKPLPRIGDALSYTARRPSDPPPVAAAFDVGRVTQLQRDLEETQSRAAKLLAELSSLRPAMLELDAARARIIELEARVAELSAPPKALDDLRRIKGVGPKFEQALRSAGVSTYAQIAAWDEADIEAIAPKIGARADRVVRDDWTGQARALLA